jgi:hypothetical protein
MLFSSFDLSLFPGERQWSETVEAGQISRVPDEVVSVQERDVDLVFPA